MRILLSVIAPYMCLDCRTLVGSGGACSGRAHRVVSLEHEEGRERLRQVTWGPPRLRERAAQAAKVGGLGAFLDGVTCSSCPADALAATGFDALALVLASLIVVFLVVGVVFWVGAVAVDWVRRRRARLRPSGVDSPAPRGERWSGRVASGATIRPPIGTGEGVAWAIALESSEAIGKGPYVLFAGESAGFRVELDDGRVLEVPAGSVRAMVGGEGWRRLSSALVSAWAADVDRRAEGEPYPPIPADRGRSLLVKVGDRVEVRAPIERVAGDAPAGYRDGLAMLRATGAPLIALA